METSRGMRRVSVSDEAGCYSRNDDRRTGTGRGVAHFKSAKMTVGKLSGGSGSSSGNSQQRL
jgi:hypothetical protein